MKPHTDSENIPFARPSLNCEEENAVIRVLRSGWITTAAETQLFESEFTQFLESQGELGGQSLAVNSATSGLHLALIAAGIGSGDVVLVPSYTFASTAEVVRYTGAEVAFIDCAPDSFLMDTRQAQIVCERLAAGATASGIAGKGPSGKPAAIIPVHFAGNSCDMNELKDLANTYKLTVIEDAAHAFPCRQTNEKFAGTLGDIGVFSFYATKTITCGEGGMIYSTNSRLIDKIKTMRLHGIDRDVWKRYSDTKASWRYDIVEAGFKYNLPDILSAIGREQLKKANTFLEARYEIAQSYNEAFKDDSRFILPPDTSGNAWHLYPLRVKNASNRDAFITQLQNKGIGVSVHFIPLHTMTYWATRYQYTSDDFPQAQKQFEAEISLPIWPGMTAQQVSRVILEVRSLR